MGDAGRPAPELIDERIAELGVWRGETPAWMRRLIHDKDAFRALVRAAIDLNGSGRR